MDKPVETDFRLGAARSWWKAALEEPTGWITLDDESVLRLETAGDGGVHNTVNALSATQLFIFKCLCYVNFASIRKETKEGDS